MRYFLDTEYNGWCGELLSLALVPEDGGEELYVTLECEPPLDAWVQANVVPFLDMVPQHLLSPRVARRDAALQVSEWLMREHERLPSVRNGARPELRILADWPEDIAHLCRLVTIGPGLIVDLPPIAFGLLYFPGFSTAANSRVPHNALHDARALRDHVLAMD